MKKQRTFSNGRNLAEQYAYEAPLIAASSMEVLREMEHLDPHLLGEYKSKKNYLNERTLDEQLTFEAKLLADDTLEIIAQMENLDPDLID
jgi:hypothetical protein